MAEQGWEHKGDYFKATVKDGMFYLEPQDQKFKLEIHEGGIFSTTGWNNADRVLGHVIDELEVIRTALLTVQ